MRTKIMTGTSAVLAAAGLGILLQSPAWAASGPQPASGTFLITSSTVESARVVGGNTILVIALIGNATGTFVGRFTETDHEVIHPDGSATLLGTGTQFGTLGTCGTGSVRYVTEQQGTVSALSGRFIDINQAGSTSTPVKIHSVDTLTVNTVAGEATYTGTYHCT
jgi:hypothetical protein